MVIVWVGSTPGIVWRRVATPKMRTFAAGDESGVLGVRTQNPTVLCESQYSR